MTPSNNLNPFSKSDEMIKNSARLLGQAEKHLALSYLVVLILAFLGASLTAVGASNKHVINFI